MSGGTAVAPYVSSGPVTSGSSDRFDGCAMIAGGTASVTDNNAARNRFRRIADDGRNRKRRKVPEETGLVFDCTGCGGRFGPQSVRGWRVAHNQASARFVRYRDSSPSPRPTAPGRSRCYDRRPLKEPTMPE